MVQHSVMLYLTSNRMIRPAVVDPSAGRGTYATHDSQQCTVSVAGVPLAAYVPARSGGRLGADGGVTGSFWNRFFGPLGGREAQGDTSTMADMERNGWHSVWCTVMSLVASLVRTLSANSQFMEQVSRCVARLFVWFESCRYSCWSSCQCSIRASSVLLPWTLLVWHQSRLAGLHAECVARFALTVACAVWKRSNALPHCCMRSVNRCAFYLVLT